MRLPTIRGIIDRRILVNYRVAPEVVAKLLPHPFRPKLCHGYAMAGICLIRLRATRPGPLPKWMGVSSENAAHRIAVEWDDNGIAQEGVYVPRRDTNSWMNSIAGGRLFPGIQYHARFDVRETSTHYEVKLNSDDGATRLSVNGDRSNDWTTSSVFKCLDEASSFYRAGSLGYSATPDSRRFQGIELQCDRWQVEPLTVKSVMSSYFENRDLFPAGSAEFDCALLMTDVEHEWHGKEDLCGDGEISA